MTKKVFHLKFERSNKCASELVTTVKMEVSSQIKQIFMYYKYVVVRNGMKYEEPLMSAQKSRLLVIDLSLYQCERIFQVHDGLMITAFKATACEECIQMLVNEFYSTYLKLHANRTFEYFFNHFNSKLNCVKQIFSFQNCDVEKYFNAAFCHRLLASSNSLGRYEFQIMFYLLVMLHEDEVTHIMSTLDKMKSMLKSQNIKRYQYLKSITSIIRNVGKKTTGFDLLIKLAFADANESDIIFKKRFIELTEDLEPFLKTHYKIFTRDFSDQRKLVTAVLLYCIGLDELKNVSVSLDLKLWNVYIMHRKFHKESASVHLKNRLLTQLFDLSEMNESLMGIFKEDLQHHFANDLSTINSAIISKCLSHFLKNLETFLVLSVKMNFSSRLAIGFVHFVFVCSLVFVKANVAQFGTKEFYSLLFLKLKHWTRVVSFFNCSRLELSHVLWLLSKLIILNQMSGFISKGDIIEVFRKCLKLTPHDNADLNNNVTQMRKTLSINTF